MVDFIIANNKIGYYDENIRSWVLQICFSPDGIIIEFGSYISNYLEFLNVENNPYMLFVWDNYIIKWNSKKHQLTLQERRSEFDAKEFSY